MRCVKWVALGFGSVPLVAWIVSMPYNAAVLGTPFTATGEWNNLPLWVATLPCHGIAVLLFDSHLLPDRRYALLLIYVAVTSAAYALFGAGLALAVVFWKRCRSKGSTG